jgi:DNA polymerase III epsilon subunit-like protein
MSQYFMAFDTETGGLDCKKADLLTAYFGIVDMEYKVVDELYLKLKPDGGRLPIAEAGALAVNGINIKQHMEDPETLTYSEAKVKVMSLIKKYAKKKGRFSNIRPLGYNVPFDVGWTQEYILPKTEWLDLLHYKNVDVMERVDFLKECSWFPPELGSLGSVNDYLQLPKRNAHNAKEDTLMTIEVYKKLIDLMKEKKDGGPSQDLISLLEAE